MHNKDLGRHSMINVEDMEGLAPEQYRSHALKAAGIHDLNMGLFYNILLLNLTPETRVFVDFVSNYDLVIHSIDSLEVAK